MVKIQKEIVTKRYREEDVYEETIIQFHYDTETEKLKHSKEMQKNGFEDSGQVRENVGNMLHPEYVWFGSYYKHVKIDDKVLPDMRRKVKEYISELDAEINKYHNMAEQNEQIAESMIITIQVLSAVKNDLQGRLEELI